MCDNNKIKNAKEDRIAEMQGEVFLIWKQLEALGALIERQGTSDDGYEELSGLGFTLTDLSSRLHKIWQSLDITQFDLK